MKGASQPLPTRLNLASQLLKIKLYVPPVRPEVVPRPRLIEQLAFEYGHLIASDHHGARTRLGYRFRLKARQLAGNLLRSSARRLTAASSTPGDATSKATPSRCNNFFR